MKAQHKRMSIFRSNRHFYIQVIDDEIGHTIYSLNTVNLKLKFNGTNLEQIASKVVNDLTDKGIKKVVFDRNGFRFVSNIRKLVLLIKEKGFEI